MATTVWNTVLHWMGLTNASGKLYLFWSGICADFVFLGSAVALYRKVNCHTKGCWRLALHEVEGTPFKVCRKHHPDIQGKPTHRDIHRAHAAAHAVEPAVLVAEAPVSNVTTAKKAAPRKRAPVKKQPAKRTGR